jgi:hypothetical protein
MATLLSALDYSTASLKRIHRRGAEGAERRESLLKLQDQPANPVFENGHVEVGEQTDLPMSV